MQASINWTLDTIFEGGVKAPNFTQKTAALRSQVETFVERAEELPSLGEKDDDWVALLLEMDAFQSEITNCWVYAHCLSCANTQDKDASRAEAIVSEIYGRFIRARVPIEDALAFETDASFNAFVNREDLKVLKPGLENIRKLAPLLLPRNEQALMEELSQDGFHAWSQLYDRNAGRLQISIDGENFSSAQVFNRFSGSDDAEERTRCFSAYKSAWANDRDLWASILTHLTGTRIVLNKKRDCGPLDDVLASARMSRKSLDAMHNAIEMFRVELLAYLEGKAQLLGLEQLGWQDLRAPLGSADISHSWDDSVEFVLTHFKSSQEPLFLLAKQAFEESWIEAEDRPNKRAGGWCASVPQNRESRIFMTHGGSFGSTVTLAHELGHAYHNSVLWDQPPSIRRVPMTLAETASVFAENVVRDAALAAAKNNDQRLAMLDARLRSAVSFLMDIPTRFQFEMGLYDLRSKGELDPDELDQLMLDCQKRCFVNALREWNPNFWSSKLHFFMSRRSFYNFPYSFGYLFSSLVYAQAQAIGPGFEARYVRLLKETGWRDAEDIAMDHLGLNLEDPETWLKAMDPIRKDLKEFKALVSN